MTDASELSNVVMEKKLEQAKNIEDQIVRDAKSDGAMGFKFDPNASPEAKAEQARKLAPPGLKLQPSTKGAVVTTDMDMGPSAAKYAKIPPPTRPPPETKVDVPTSPTSLASPNTPQRTSNGYPKAGDGEWGRTGWAPRIGLGETDDENSSLLDHTTMLEKHLDDKFFGDWWHNAGIMVFACLSTWICTILGGGLATVCIILAICSTYYRTSIRRVRRNVRDDLNREFAKNRLETDVESLEWINSFAVKFWPIYQPVLAATVINSVDQVLATATPAFLDSLRLSTFTLGSKPPRIESVKTYPKTEDDIVVMDWKFSFNPNDTDDLTSKQVKNRVNPKVVLEVRVGKGIVSKGIPIVVEDMAFSGLMRVKIKLQIAFPHIEKVDVCFLEKPIFDYVLKPIGGETFGFDIGFLPGLSGFIQEQVHANLGPMLYDPNVFTINVAQMLGGAGIETAIGVLQVTIHQGQGLRNPDKFSGTPDPYIVLSLNHRQELARTQTKKETGNPKWAETVYLILTSLNDSLTLEAFDYNEYRKDKTLGVAALALENFDKDNEQENCTVPIMANGKARGLITMDARFFPVLTGKKLDDGTVEPVPETNTGIVKYTVHQVKDMDGSKSMVGQLSPYAVLLLNGREQKKSKPQKRTNNPVFDFSHEMLITNRINCRLGLVLKDDRDIATDPILGTYQIKLDDAIDCMKKGQEWFDLSNAKSGRVKFSVDWKPVAMKGVLGGTGGYITPVGVVRIHCRNGRDLRNLETVGKSDPYVRALLSGVERGKTVTFKNNLDPDWDEVIYIPVHSSRERLTLEVMDEEGVSKDRSLGQVEVNLDDYIRKGDNGEYQTHNERIEQSEPLYLGRAKKGLLNFNLSFYPCVNVADPEEEEATQTDKRQKDSSSLTQDDQSPEPIDEKTTQKEVAAKAMAEALSEENMAGGEPKSPAKVRMTPEELLSNESGLLIFKFIEGELAQSGSYLEVLIDDALFPAFVSTKLKSRMTKIDEVGDAFIRELDVSRITIRLRSKSDEKDNSTIAQLAGQTLETLKQCLNNPTVLSLKGKDSSVSKIKISLKYIPVKINLDAFESINNMGSLRVDIYDAANLPSADRNGKSDPYCVFKSNDTEVYKTKTQKKTLNPAWNEYFETTISSRVAANFECKVYDWDLGGSHDFLGAAKVPLANLEPFKPKEVNLPLDGKSGTVRLRLLFKPDYVTRSRIGSSTFSGTFATPGKIVTGVAGAPIKGIGLAAGGVGKGASFIKRGFTGKSASKSENEVFGDGIDIKRSILTAEEGSSTTAHESGRDPPVPVLSEDGLQDESNGRSSGSVSPALNNNGGYLSSPHSRQKSSSGMSVISNNGAKGTAIIKLVSATGFNPSANVRLFLRTVGPKSKEVFKSKAVKSASSHIQWDESVSVPCTADQQFKVSAEDHHTFGRDEDLGEGTLVVDDSTPTSDVTVQIGPATVIFKISFLPADSTGSSSPKGLRKSLPGRKRNVSSSSTQPPPAF